MNWIYNWNFAVEPALLSMSGKFIIINIITITIYYHRGSLPRVNRSWCEVDQSLLFSADVKIGCSYVSTSPIDFLALTVTA